MLSPWAKSPVTWQVECHSHSSRLGDQRFKELIPLESHTERMCFDALFLDVLRYRYSESFFITLCNRQQGLLLLELCSEL